MCSDTDEMEDVLEDFLKADALISTMEEKLEIMYKYDNGDDEYYCAVWPQNLSAFWNASGQKFSFILRNRHMS